MRNKFSYQSPLTDRVYMLTMETSPPFAAVDLGSNSFHMIIGRFRLGKLDVMAKFRDMVQLGTELDEANMLSSKAMQRGLTALQHFATLLIEHQPEGMRVVGTATLRNAKNGAEFTAAAEQILNYPIEIISGDEEAKLIYNGVFNSNAIADDENILVVDIGGRSTEIIYGTHRTSSSAVSLNIGCISATHDIFPHEVVMAKDILTGQTFIRKQLDNRIPQFTHIPARVFGASGTVKAIGKIVNDCAWSHDGYISRDSLDRLFASISNTSHLSELKFDDLSKKRMKVFPGGIILLREIFRSLKIEQMEISRGALREGVLFDLLAKYKARS